MTATVHDLLAELGTATDFADAACIGRWAWFDPPNDYEPAASVQSRHQAAVHLCGTCPLPVFARCAALSRTLPKAGRHGVWAGRSYDTPIPGRKSQSDGGADAMVPVPTAMSGERAHSRAVTLSAPPPPGLVLTRAHPGGT